MRRRLGARRVNEAPRPLPSELEARIVALENDGTGTDFDVRSWIWMVLFGMVLPATLILLGG